MNSKLAVFSFISAVFFGWITGGYAQTDNQKAGPQNVIKFNITSRMLFGKDNYVIGYERKFKNHNRTLNVDMGYRSLPKLISVGSEDSSFFIRDHKNNGGFNVAIDYRFYLTKRNVNAAPDGIYIGPFADYFYNKFTNDISDFYADDGAEVQFSIDTRINLFSVGFRLGYQFIIWDRLAIDLVLLGPSLTFYTANLDLLGGIDADDENEYYQDLKEALINKYPFIEDLLDDSTVDKNGHFSTRTLGFNYSIRIGYAF